MTALDTSPRGGPAADAVCVAVVAAHARLNAGPALTLSNRIGAPEAVRAAIASARRGLGPEGDG